MTIIRKHEIGQPPLSNTLSLSISPPPPSLPLSPSLSASLRLSPHALSRPLPPSRYVVTHNGRVKCGARNASVQGGGITELQDQVRGERDRQTYREAFRQTGREAGRHYS
jgi:hypothetical protein